MKQHLLLVFILFLNFNTLSAQEVMPSSAPMRTPEELAQKQTERLQRDLELTSQQRDTIYRIHLKYAKMRRRTDTHEIMECRMRKMSEELVPILTEEQKVLYRQFLREIGPKRHSSPRMRTAEAVETAE